MMDFLNFIGRDLETFAGFLVFAVLTFWGVERLVRAMRRPIEVTCNCNCSCDCDRGDG